MREQVPRLSLHGIAKSFETRHGRVNAIDSIDLDVAASTVVTIVGPSGCGKTTLLRIAAGLEKPTAGKVLLDGVQIERPGSERGMVFQHLALFPHLTVRKNVEFGLKMRGDPLSSRREASQEVLSLVGLSGFEDAYPRELSGGMQQRLAIARTLVVEPTIVLMDEPFGSLDAQTRVTMQELLSGLVERTAMTTLLVTHSVEEAAFLADRVIVLSGRPAQIVAIFDVPEQEVWRGLALPEVETTSEYGELKHKIWSFVRPRDEVRNLTDA